MQLSNKLSNCHPVARESKRRHGK